MLLHSRLELGEGQFAYESPFTYDVSLKVNLVIVISLQPALNFKLLITTVPVPTPI